jgi:phosphoribosylformylglycinamidine synthase
MPTAPAPSIRRVYVEKRPEFADEARRLRAELIEFLGAERPELAALGALRLLHRYDVAHLDAAAFDRAVRTVFAEPQCDAWHLGELPPLAADERLLAVEYLPGQYDQRADSAEQCAELAVGIKPIVRTARVYALAGAAGPLSDAALDAMAAYLVNPVDSRRAVLGLPASLEAAAAEPAAVPRLAGFRSAGDGELAAMAKDFALAMSPADLAFCRDHFRSLGRDPSLAELRVLDTYWSDHCRHSTFTTKLEAVEVADGPDAAALRAAWKGYEAARAELYGEAGAAARPKTLMDLATLGAKLLRKRGKLDDLEVSEEINACSVRVKAEFADGGAEPWLLMFKNETHNHPTEIEPFGGAATCLGGAIRDPLSGRAFVHQAMRVTGAGDPRAPLAATLPGKLPQLKICREAAAGYASYGNQIGLTTGQVSEFYHPGFLAKRLELGAVIGAAPEAWVRRDEPEAGDVVLMVGGATGRDGIGGATGSSKAHTDESVRTAGAEVQKGNAVEERKIQRLFRDPAATRLIKRCNDFGAGGVAVAVGELARGLDIDLDAVPKKYAGLDGVELAISESQERMAVVVAPADAAAFIRLAAKENLTAVQVATVTAGASASSAASVSPAADGGHLRMTWRGDRIVDLERLFLDTNGAPRAAKVLIAPTAPTQPTQPIGAAAAGAANADVLLDELERELRSLRSGSRRGLQERFDGSIGCSSVLFPWGGRDQGTPECGMAALLPSLEKDCVTASLMTFGYDPGLGELSPYRAAKAAVRLALAKFACLGGDPWTARLSLQEYFERTASPEAWGKPLAALLGALEAQLALSVPAIGGKDSMSGTYRDPSNGRELTVPPTLVCFAAGVAPAAAVRSGSLSGAAGNLVLLLAQPGAAAAGAAAPGAAAPDAAVAGAGLDEWAAFKANLDALAALSAAGVVRAAYPVDSGGAAASLALMAFGNGVGVECDAAAAVLAAGEAYAGSVLVEVDAAAFEARAGELGAVLDGAASWAVVGRTLGRPVFRMAAAGAEAGAPDGDEAAQARSAEAPLDLLRRAFEYPLARVYPQTAAGHTAAEAAAAAAEPGAALKLPAYAPAAAPRPAKPSARTARSAAPDAKGAAPLVVLPAFPGTNCEWDMARAFRRAGARVQIVVFRNRGREDVLEATAELAAAIRSAQIVALSGGFSAGDEPDGSGKFIAAAFRAPAVEAAVADLLQKRDGLVLGVCNGFQALIKLGLVPYGEYREPAADSPTLTYNAVGRHVSRLVRTKVLPNASPWLALDPAGSIHTVPVSHGEGRVAIRDDLARALFAAGQAPFVYVDGDDRPTMAEPANPNGSAWAIEGLSSPDGRVLGKMGHSERVGPYVHVNVPGAKTQRIFEAGARYFA